MKDESFQLESVKRSAVALGVSPYALYRKLKNGDLPGYRFGRKVLINLEEVRSAMRTHSLKNQKGGGL